MNSHIIRLTRGVVAVAAAALLSCGSSISWARQDTPGMQHAPGPGGKPSRPTATVINPMVAPGMVGPGVPQVKPGKPAPRPEPKPKPRPEPKPPAPGPKPSHGKSHPPEVVHWSHGPDRDRHPDRPYYHRPPKHYGTVYRSLPPNVFSFFLGGSTFFYYSGLYYRHGVDGYVVVQAPIGARIHVLPDDCSYFYYNGDRCYACDDVFYREVGREYLVIERPPRFDVIVEPGDLVRITTDALNVRSGPGAQFRVMGQLIRGDIVEVGAIEDGWYYVRFGNDSYGWVMQRYTNPYDVYNGPKG